MGRPGRKLPLWKFKREALRFVRQIARAPSVLGNYFFGTLYYDLVHAGKVRRMPGQLALTDKVAIYLIYPQYGLQPSHLRALDYLKAKGYAPVVVSNLELAGSDREQVLKASYLYIERPNFGYDFGGYRDGILSLRAALPGLRHLCILNDSTWFNLPGASDWLQEAEGAGVDLGAAALNHGVSRVEITDFRTVVWRYQTTHKNFHFCSFALLFSGKVLTDPGFLRFWQRFALTNDKGRTVRRGEIGLSKWILGQNFTHTVTCDLTHLDQELADLDNVRLREVAASLIIPENPRFQAIKHQLLAGTPSRKDMISLILTGVARQGSSYALADFTITEKRFPFLKKSPVWLNRETSDITLKLAAALPAPEGAEILAEAIALRQRRAPQFDRPA